MNMIDTHAHLFSPEFSNDLDEVVKRARETGVNKVLLPNIDSESINNLLESYNSYPDFFLPMMGLHPTSVKSNWKEELSTIYNELLNNKYIAIGEIGIDLYWSDTYKNEQIQVFEDQLKWSSEMNLPVSIHFRNAVEEVIKSIKRIGGSLRGVFHSFGGDKDELEAILKLDNFFIGVNGVVTFKNSGLANTLVNCPLERVVIETDSPYLAPVPYRGKRNESSYMSYILKKLSEIWQKNDEDVAIITTGNANRMFGI